MIFFGCNLIFDFWVAPVRAQITLPKLAPLLDYSMQPTIYELNIKLENLKFLRSTSGED